MSIRRQVLPALTVLLGTYLTIVLSREIVKLLATRERIEKEQAAVQRLEAEQQDLAQELEYVASEAFVEKEAREKLLMGKPGEVVVLFEEEPVGDQGEPGVGSEDLANWEKWVRLFF